MKIPPPNCKARQLIVRMIERYARKGKTYTQRRSLAPGAGVTVRRGKRHARRIWYSIDSDLCAIENLTRVSLKFYGSSVQ